MIKGVIFDMDGVISDTQKFHAQIESELLSKFGINIAPDEITKKYAGVKTRQFFDELLKQQNIAYNLDKLMEEKWKKMESIASKSIEEIPGSIKLIKRFAEDNLPLAVASASNLKYVKSVLEALGVINYFDAIIGGDMVSRGKPDPESFLLAASKINILPEECLVIEDGISGMLAAKTANMKCIGLVKDTKLSYPTENTILSLDEISKDYLENIK